MADIKNFGIKGLSSDVQLGKSGGRLKYDASNGRFDLTGSDGSTLENVRLGSVVAGAWNGDAIDAQYGGLGDDFSSATGVVSFVGGVASAGTIDLSNTSFVSGAVAVANGGTGATTASDARTNLGLGSIATQDSNNIALTGGALNGVIIGASSAAAGSFTAVSASSGFTGNLTGDVTGNADSATALETARNFSVTGDASASAVSFDGTENVALNVTLANSGVTAGEYGSTTEIPVLTVDAKGRVTAVSTESISTNFGIAGDSGSDTVAGGETLTFSGTANQIVTSVSDNEVTVSLADNLTVGNVTIEGTLRSDDITASTVSVDGDAIITGNLTVQGTQTVIESTTVQTEDAVFRTNSNGANTDAGFEANTASGVKQILYTSVGQEWDFGSEDVKASGFIGDLTGDVTGNLTGDVTGTVSDISNHSTSDLTEGTNLYYTDARVETKIDSHVSGGTGLSYSAGEVSLDDTAVTAGSYGSSTAIPTFTVDAQGRLTAAGTASVSTGFDIVGDDGTVDSFANGDTLSILGGTNVTTATSNDTITVNLDSDITVDSVTATTLSGDLTGDVTGSISGATGSFTGAVTAGSLTDGSATLAGGELSGLSNVSLSGTVAAGTLTDGTASISGGDITGAGDITASGAIEASSLTDGTATLASGELDAVSGTFSGAVEFGTITDGSLTINGFVDEDNMASDSASLVPTQQSVKAYVDSKVTAQDIDFGGDTGTGAVDLDSQSLTIAGGNNITTSADGQTLSVALDSSLTGLSSVTSTSFAGNLTGNVTGDVTGDLTGDVTGNLTGNVTGNVTGNLTGDVTGDVTGTVSDISNHSTSDLSEGTNKYFTDARARSSISVVNAGGDGQVAYNSTTGAITYTGPSASETRAHFSAGTGLEVSAGEFAISDSGVTAASYGSTTAVPVITVNAQGQITSATTATIVTSFDIGADNGTDDTVSGGEKLTVSGTANQVVTTVSNNAITVALDDNLTVGNVTVEGTLRSDDITATQVTVDGDTVITGNLTVQGTQTIVESTTISTGDAVVRVNSDGAAVSAGIEANVSGTIESVVYNPASGNWEASSTFASSEGFEGDLTGDVTGNLTGDVTGTVSDISNHSTTDLTEGTNLYYTDARARASISVSDTGGDGSVSYDSATGVISFTGPSASEVRAHFSAGTGVSITDGEVAIGQAVGTTDNVTFSSVTAALTGNVTGDVTGDLTGNVSFGE